MGLKKGAGSLRDGDAVVGDAVGSADGDAVGDAVGSADFLCCAGDDEEEEEDEERSLLRYVAVIYVSRGGC